MTTNGSKPVPGPKGYPGVGVVPSLARDPIAFCTAAMREHDDLVRLDLGFASAYLVTLPEHLQHVLVDNQENYWKGKIFNRARFLFGNGLVLNEGAPWRHQRRLMQPAFQHKRIESLIPLMAGVIRRKLERWEEGGLLEMNHQMMTFTLEIVAKTMFSLSVTDAQLAQFARSFDTALKHMSLRMNTFFLPEWVPLPGRKACDEAVLALERLVHGIIEERRRSGERPDDLLTLLLDAQDEESGEGMGDTQLRDEVVTTLFGGYEATADALTWTWYFLSRNPEVDSRVREEVASVLGGKEPAFEDLGKLEYTSRVIQEVLRFYPSFWFSPRASYQDDVIGGHHVPGGSVLILSHYSTHHHPRLWEDPERFDPDRFLPERSEGRPRNAYFPFGTGPRMCIGRHFANLEMLLVLAMTVQQWRPRLAPGRSVEPVARIAIRSKNGVWMNLEKG
jgi:cytochrome P450